MIVTVKQGSLCGKKKTTILNKKPYISFLGIPYGEPPVGLLRFQAPRPLEKWEGVYNAIHEGKSCVQKSPMNQSIVGSEDCLYLNVYTPETSLPIKKLKAVMVFIHGGGFCHGSGSHHVYGPDYLIEHDIILVTINYRVQALGFLNLGIPECPGNVGLKDQVLALKWIQENIIHFGGNSANVTIFGESAGASSVFYHIISPLSRGLFHRAIAQSGTCLSSWAFVSKPTEIAFAIGHKLGYKGYDRLGLLYYLRNIPAENLIKAGQEMRDFLLNTEKSSSLFAPSIESIKDGAMLPEHPRVLLAIAPPIPMICGCNDAEGIFGIGMMSEERLKYVCEDITPVLKKAFSINPDDLHNIASQVKQLYFTDDQDRKQKLQSLANLLTDIFFYYFEESIEAASKSCFPPYIYEFAHAGGQNLMKKMMMLKSKCIFKGACHGDELDYLFHRKFHSAHRKFDPTDLRVIKDMCSIWTNFAKTGNPEVPVWRPSIPGQPCYLRIEADSLQLISGTVHGPRRQLLKNILASYELKIFSTN